MTELWLAIVRGIVSCCFSFPFDISDVEQASQSLPEETQGCSMPDEDSAATRPTRLALVNSVMAPPRSACLLQPLGHRKCEKEVWSAHRGHQTWARKLEPS